MRDSGLLYVGTAKTIVFACRCRLASPGGGRWPRNFGTPADCLRPRLIPAFGLRFHRSGKGNIRNVVMTKDALHFLNATQLSSA